MHPRIAAIVLASILTAIPAVASEITALIGLPAKHVVEELAPQFEKSSGSTLKVTYSGGLDTRERMASGEVFDVLVAARQDLDAFAKEDKLLAGSLVDIMKSQMGVATRAGAPRPDIGSDAGMKKTLLNAKAIGYSTGPSGDYLKRTLLPKLGIADQVAGKLKQVPSGTSVATLIASGDVEIGLQQTSELLNQSGVD